MAQHNRLGQRGEKYATEYLMSRGYVIREVNWVSGKFELDIVAYRDETIVVVEVKTRSSDDIAFPEEAVTTKKIRNIVRATDAYIRMNALDMEVRFDVISIVGKEPPYEIEHIEDAFVTPVNV